MRQHLDELLDKPLGHWIGLNWEKVLYATLIVLAVATRLWGLGIRVQSHDESLHTKYSWNLYAGQGFQHTPLMHGPFLFHATALTYFLFGDNDFTARLAIALIGMALVAFPYLLRRWLGREGALLTSFLLLISPSIAYYSRYIRHDIPIILWALTVVYAVFSYLADGRDRWLYLMASGVSLMFATKEVAFIYNAIFGFFLVGLFVRQAIAQDWGKHETLKRLLGVVLVVVALGLLIVGLGALSQGAGQDESAAVLPHWAVVGGIVTATAMLVGAAVLLVGMWDSLRTCRTFDLIIVLGTLCLPFLSPIPIQLLGLDPVDYTTPTIYYSGAITAAVLTFSALIGLWWNWRRWSIVAAIHYGIFMVLFTTVFTNGTGIASGLVGSMGYWLAQQSVQRGDQPWYYYGIVVPLYEYLPLLLTVITASALGIRAAVRASRPSKPTDSDQALQHRADRWFIPFLLWWIGMTWAIYSYAGEKMPWLTTHIALPMILLAAWGTGQFIRTINWQKVLKNQLWIPTILAAPLAIALYTLIYSASKGPFQGSSLTELTVTGQFLGSLVAVLGLGGGLIYAIRKNEPLQSEHLSLRVLLLGLLLVPLLLTIRHSWRFCYINQDYPIEHLVYAHAAPAVKETMNQIEELSRRTAGGPRQIEVAYGADGSWPFHWYLRDYANAVFYGENPTREQMEAPVIIAGRGEWDAVAPYLANNYIANTYTYLWWPMEDYKGLTWQRIKNALSNPRMRAALWDIWYDRDYRLYDQATGKTHTLDEWPLRSEYRLYVRRDALAQVWDRSYLGPAELEQVEPYSEHQLELVARKVFGVQGSGQGEFQSPRGIAVGLDGSVYVADSGNHRIQEFSADGEFLDSWGERSLAEEELGTAQGFNEPWDVAVAPAAPGSSGTPTVYVADTWNHRIQKLDSQGGLIQSWGVFGEFGPDDREVGQSAFYGPRGVVVARTLPKEDPEGASLVYVTDTGNKRVQVFEATGNFAFQWGGGGTAESYLDEPVGIAIGPKGDVYIADTWNRRIQVFDSKGAYLRQWPIRGWNSGLPEEKPYLAVDDGGRVYVTDPGSYRVLVFDGEGNILVSFGQYGQDDQSFTLPQGIAVAADGTIYVTDAHAHRVLIFDPISFEQLQE